MDIKTLSADKKKQKGLRHPDFSIRQEEPPVAYHAPISALPTTDHNSPDGAEKTLITA